MTTHSPRATRALLHLADRDPALAMLGLWCTHRETDGPTRTTGDTVHYGTEFDGLEVQEQVGLTGHHILHIALRHPSRHAGMSERLGNAFDPMLYALCADAIVNETLTSAGHALPRPAVTLAGLLVAAALPNETRTPLADWTTERLYFALLAAPPARKGARDYAQTLGFKPDFDGDKTSQTAPDEDWRGHLQRALQVGQTAGQGIGALRALLRDAQPSGVPWEVLLRRHLARALTQTPRPSHARPARRWIAAETDARRRGTPVPAFEPAILRNGHRLSVAIGLDLSSSIDDLTLDLFAAEITALSRRTGADLTILGFDTQVRGTVRPGHSLREALHSFDAQRGGGTDFGPVLTLASALAPSAIVMLTDLDGPLGPAPKAPVIWTVKRSPQTPPPFGKLVVMEPD